MKILRKLIPLVLTLSLTLSLACPAMAASSSGKNVTLVCRAITISVDGDAIVPMDANGVKVEPFIYAGRTYMPLTAAANAMGLKVTWDGTTRTVDIQSGGTVNPGSGAPLASNGKRTAVIYYSGIKITLNGKPAVLKETDGTVIEPFIYNKTTYLPVGIIASLLGVPVSWDGSTSTVNFGRKAVWKPVHYELSDQFSKSYTIDYKYDEKGRELSAVMAYKDMSGGYTEQYTYNAAGLLSSTVHTDSADASESYTRTLTYDDSSRPVKAEYRYGDGSTNTQTVSYYPDGKIHTQTAASSGGDYNMLEFKYNAAGKVISKVQTDKNNQVTASLSTEYDAYGRVKSQKQTVAGKPDMNYTAAYTYSKSGSTEKITYGDGFWTVYTTVNNSDGSQTQTSTDSDGKKQVRSYTYDAYGHMTAMTVHTTEADGTVANSTTGLSYDKNGNRVAARYSDGGRETYTYQKFYTEG